MNDPMFFEEAFQYTMKDEGGDIFVDNPSDPGGATKWGVSLKFYRSYKKNPLLGPNDIKAMTEDEARIIARTEFWDRLNLDFCTSKAVAIALLDQAYLKGPSGCAACAQWALKQRGCQIKVDGILGSDSWTAINATDPEAFLNDFVSQLKDQFDGLAHVNPAIASNLQGWINRANRLLQLVS